MNALRAYKEIIENIMKKGYKQICTVRRAFSNPQIYPGIPAITSGINPACVMNV